MSFSTTSSLQYRFRATPNDEQILILRFGHCSRLICRFPSPEIIPDLVLQQTPSTLMGETFICFSDMRDAREQQAVAFVVNGFLHSFNLHSSDCQIICRKIIFFAVQIDTNNGNFKKEANMDHMEELIWMESVPRVYPVSMMGEEGFEVVFEEDSSPERRSGAPEWLIERIRKEKFDGFREDVEEEKGDCSVCLEELKSKRKEVSRIGCGHVYHKECLLRWVERSNTCTITTMTFSLLCF